MVRNHNFTLAITLSVSALVFSALVYSQRTSEAASTRSAAEKPTSSQGLTYEDWKEAFEIAKASVSEGTDKQTGIDYIWTGPSPIRVHGHIVSRASLALSAEAEAELADRVFQPDPVEYAELVRSPLWVASGSSHTEGRCLFVDDGAPTNCQVVVKQTGTGTLMTSCEGPCGPVTVCNGNVQPNPTYCNCTVGSQAPTSPPATCHGEATIIEPTIIQLNCTGTCGTGKCKEAYHVHGGLDWFYCKCL